ncbi:LCP family protein [Streptomyces sp. NBC_00249]|uniref:LCP family protein n=1 Tax=Streptomyces sp. NBC_00249 TaxID=2975690 RepID=UPI00224EFCF9|nr:LCP family protein [Streptomyces sp. NBC_00249]MCX5198840.1 LCP family protein [Streptomyces sp. NBC_00249]
MLLWVSSVLAFLILGTSAAGYLYYRHLDGNIRSGQRLSGDSGVEKTHANAKGQRPLNILLLGSDSRNKPENLELGGSHDSVGAPPLADVQMMVHVSADRENASVVSIPRDTRVDIPECTDPKTGKKYKKTHAMINESLGRGGPGCTLATWEKLTNVYIDHWMMIDFSGVVQMADAIGGVPVCVKDNVWDRPLATSGGGSGLKLTAGTTKVKGEQALQWLRTRHAFSSDLGRAQAQHMYMNSMMRELKGQNAFTDVGRITALAEAGTKALEVSEEIGSVKKLFNLAMQLKDIPTNRITMTTMPTFQDPRDEDRLVVNTADADKLWAMVRKDVAFDKNGAPTTPESPAAATPTPTPGTGSPQPGTSAPQPGASSQQPATPSPEPSKTPPTAPDKVAVHVVNGTAAGQPLAPGRANAIAEALVAKGFTSARADSALTPEKTTVVRYPTADLADEAQSVAAAMGIPASAVVPAAGISKVTLVIGADWREGTAYPQQAPPQAGAVPDTADAINGSDSGACMEVYKPYRW